MGVPHVKKIALMASHDWTLRMAMAEFLDYLQPVIKWKNKEYTLELTRVIACPLLAGSDLTKTADLIVDRTTHWNTYYRAWGHQAANSLARTVNHPYTFFVFDKHSTYDLMARAIHPQDEFPKTVLLPQFHPWSEDQKKQAWWKYEQELILENTEFGFDEARKNTDWETVHKELQEAKRYDRRSQIVREHFYDPGDYLRETVENVFDGKFPLYLKKAYGGGGSNVYRINNLQELYSQYDRTGDETFHLQEAVEPYDIFYRAMGIGPINFPMFFQPDKSFHEHYSPEKPLMNKNIFYRLESYAMFINSYHRWTYNSFEAVTKNGKLHPIDFANACPDSQFISLHVHFPLLVCSLLKWLAFCAVTEKDMKIDLELTRYLSVLNNPDVTQQEKFDFCRKLSEVYFETEKFNEFCELNFKTLDEQMIDFYDVKFDEIIDFSIEFSNFPEHEHDKFCNQYKNLMNDVWKPNAEKYLEPVIFDA